MGVHAYRKMSDIDKRDARALAREAMRYSGQGVLLSDAGEALDRALDHIELLEKELARIEKLSEEAYLLLKKEGLL